ncbi:MAG: cysteine desulfurase family protein [Eubacteriales bacterium]|nr:cysteine desulfurase family protein [Eubacteriales bacterium]
MDKIIYIDNSSTTRQADEVTDVMDDVMRNHFGNPSSLHHLGMDSEKFVKDARKRVADAFGCKPDELYFNSGGTEGDNTVLFGAARAKRHERKKIVISAVEHHAIMEAADVLKQFGFEICEIPVDGECGIDMDALREAVDENTALVSVMTVNNEVGTVMPVNEIGDIAHAKGALFHSDAVQAYGKVRLSDLNADFYTMSAHKIHGPKGVGAMVMRKNARIPALIVGGGQERHFRSGTENVPGIAGLGEATRLAYDFLDENEAKMAEVHEFLLKGIKDNIKDVVINSPDDGIASVLNVSFLGTRGEVLLHMLEQDGIFISTGSACASNGKGGSHVLKAMGKSDEEIEGAIRFSFSRYNTVEQMEFVLDKLIRDVKRFRDLGMFK